MLRPFAMDLVAAGAGTSAFQCLGPPPSSEYSSILGSFGSGQLVWYMARQSVSTGTKWEEGYGIITSGSPNPTLTRNVKRSFNGVSLGSSTIDFQSGDGQLVVYCVPASDFLIGVHTHWRGTSAPTPAVAGMIWQDTTTVTAVVFKVYDGTDWIALPFTINETTNVVTLTTANVAYTNVANTFTALQTISLTTATTNLLLFSSDGGAGAGPGLDLYRQSPSPANNDLGGFINFNLRTLGTNDENIVGLLSYLLDNTNGAENAGFDLNILHQGTITTLMSWRGGTAAGGITVGNPTGSFKGFGTLNVASGIYDSGARIGVPSVAVYQEQQTSGTDGGTFTSGAWQTRALNSEVLDPDGIASLSSNQITLAAGRWRIDWWAVAMVVNNHQTRIFNVTDTAVIKYGSTNRSGLDSVQNPSVGSAVVTLAGSKAIRLEHRCETTRNTDGFGNASSFGNVECYSEVTVQKLAA